MADKRYSSFASSFTYDVFLSFRGSDTRSGFINSLYKALVVEGISTFIHDEELERRDEITPAVVKAIQESRIAIPVLSKNYASSSLCLDQLVNITERVSAKGRLTFPVFYDVEPSEVRHCTGAYGEALAEHVERFKDNRQKLQKWREALHQAAGLSGHYFKHRAGYENKFIEKIVEDVSSKINRMPLHVANYPVGLDSRLRDVFSLMDVGSNDGVLMVGIAGMGGVGKSTLARAVYNLTADHFEGSCFLDNVREYASRHGLVHLQEMVLSQILGSKHIHFGNIHEGASVIKGRLHQRKVLLVLDDVDQIGQLNALVGGPDWFGSGSRVIITTRDRHLLSVHGVKDKYIYTAKGLNDMEALELLRWNAFRYGNVNPTYTEVLNQAVTYASGLPLALEVIGSLLFGRNLKLWRSALERLKVLPDELILNTLKVSYDDLGKDEQRVFLDIACCFKGYDLAEVERILHAHYGYNMKLHIEVLIERSLMSINSDGKVTIHPLIEAMGKEIVRQESPKEVGRRSRLWFPEDIVQVLKKKMGTSKIELIHLDFPLIEEVKWDGEAFKEMKNLRTLIIRKCHFSKAPIHLPNGLRVLEWWNYPSEEFPSDFHAEELAILKPEQLLKAAVQRGFQAEMTRRAVGLLETSHRVPQVILQTLKRGFQIGTAAVQRGFQAEVTRRPVGLLQTSQNVPGVLMTSNRVPQVILQTSQRAFHIGMAAVQRGFQAEMTRRAVGLLETSHRVPQVILQTLKRGFQIGTAAVQRSFQADVTRRPIGLLQNSQNVPGVLLSTHNVPQVILQTSERGFHIGMASVQRGFQAKVTRRPVGLLQTSQNVPGVLLTSRRVPQVILQTSKRGFQIGKAPVQRGFQAEVTRRPVGLLQTSHNFPRVLMTSNRVPQVILQTSQRGFQIGMAAVQRGFQAEVTRRHVGLLQTSQNVRGVLLTSHRVPEVILRTSKRDFQIGKVAVQRGFQADVTRRPAGLLQASQNVPGVLMTSHGVPQVILQTSQRGFQIGVAAIQRGFQAEVTRRPVGLLQTSQNVPGVLLTSRRVPQVILQTSKRGFQIGKAAVQRGCQAEVTLRPVGLLQASQNVRGVLLTSHTVPQVILQTSQRGFQIGMEGVQRGFQAEVTRRPVGPLQTSQNVPGVLLTSHRVPQVILQPSKRGFQIGIVCRFLGLFHTSLIIPRVLPISLRDSQVMLQVSQQAHMVWILVGMTSSVAGLLCHALSPSFKRLIGGWNVFKLLLYCVFSVVVCATVLFAKELSTLRLQGRRKSFMLFAVLIIISVYSFLYDKAVNAKPEIKSLVYNASFALVSLSMSKLIKSGYEIGMFAYFLSCFTIQLLTIYWLLISVAIIFGYPLFVMHSSSDSPLDDGNGGDVIHSSLDSRPEVGSGGQHVINIPREGNYSKEQTV